MTAQAPYWGKLPPPNVSRTPSTRRNEDHPTLSVNTKGGLQNPESQSRQNRFSTQTAATTATASTQSPFVSPVDSSFRGDGLAPRPVSYKYGAPYPSAQLDVNKDYLDKRRRRESRNKEFYEGNTNAPLPAAPDVPRAPPLSYKQLYNESPPVGSSSAPISNVKAPEDYYRSESKISSNTNGRGVARSGTVDSRRERPVHNTSQRKGSLSEAEEKRRREWADDRSPLQRLELTLDSITKEEKRARVEEAELLAREDKSGRGGSRSNENSVRFRNRPVAVKPSDEIEPQNLPEAGLARNSSNTQKDRLLRNGSVQRARPASSVVTPTNSGRILDYQPRNGSIDNSRRVEQASVPSRGSSLHDRSAVPAAAAGAVAAAELARSTSKRLKKEPPGDPWFNQRNEAEKNFKAVEPRRHSDIPFTERKAVPLAAPSNLAGRPINSASYEANVDVDIVRTRPEPTKKAEQMPGNRAATIRAVPPEDMEQPQELDLARQRQLDREVRTELVTVNGIKYAVPPTLVPGNSSHDDAPRHKQDHHHLSDMLHHRHHDLPGGGVYAPSRRLDEWKKASVALLSGALLDLDITNERTEAEQDTAWWEAGHTGKRRGSSTKQRQAEAYDGEYDDTNGTVALSLSSDSSHEDCGDSAPGEGYYLKWTKSEVLVTPRARRYIGYIGESQKQKKRQRSNKSWLIQPASPPHDLQKSTVAFLSKLSLRLPFHRYRSSKQDLPKSFNQLSTRIHSLICATRPIAARDVIAPTRFKPALFLNTGPLLRYCGMRRERLQNPSNRSANHPREREIWRGSVMIVTEDARSSYELAPTLRLFLQPTDLLPPPPAQVDGGADELPQEYVDPIAGLPKVGRDGRTLYIRPVEHLEEEMDLSKLESDEGLFEMHRSNLDGTPEQKVPPTDRNVKTKIDGEKAGKYKEVKGFRLHAERGVTFWRFNIEVELRDMQQRIAYRINRGPATGFWVPGRDQTMNIMFHSCNGFSMSVNPDQFSGPDPMWRDVLNNHQTRPFHVMLGGGDQIYNDAVMEGTTIFKEWLSIKNPLHKEGEPFTPEMQDELEAFYLERYSMWFSQGLFGLANSQIPMINIYDDHDIIDGYGSYPDHYMRCPVMCGLGSVAFKYYMLFQHQSSIDEGENNEPSWILGAQPGPYISELSRSVFTHLGRNIAFLGLDCRTERMHDEVVSAETYEKVFNRLEKDIIKGVTKHLIVLLGVPIAYPRMVWLENILTSRMFEPVKALGRAGLLGKGLLNHFDGGVEVLDDLDDHWTARNHKEERNWLIQELQDLAAEKSVRITILGGDVHLAAVGQFYSNPKLKLPKDQDYRYIPNVISSAIVNTPPPDMLADVLNKRNKVHHLDRETDEDMISLFTHDVNGKNRNNKRLLNRRNWCSIRQYDAELTPPPTPDTPSDERSPSPPPRRGILRRLSTSRRVSDSRGPSYRPDAAAPPLSNTRFFNRRPSFTSRRSSIDSQRPGPLTRTLSLTRKDFLPGIFKRKGRRRSDDGGINGYGSYSDSDDDDNSYVDPPQRSGLRGGSGGPAHSPEEDYFGPRNGKEPAHPVDQATTSVAGASPQVGGLVRSKYHRTPTGLSEKQRASAENGRHDVNLEGGLDICLNVEVNQKDPAGITMPYRLLVPRLWYEGDSLDDGQSIRSKRNTGLSRLMSFKSKDREA